MEVKLASPQWGLSPPNLGNICHILTWIGGDRLEDGGGNDNNNNNDADPPCPILPLRAPPQQPNISPMLLMTKTGTNTRMPPLPLPLPLTLTTRVGRRSGRGRRLPPYHRDLWRSSHRITPALLCLLVQIARGAARTDKHAPAWFPIPCDKEGIC